MPSDLNKTGVEEPKFNPLNTETMPMPESAPEQTIEQSREHQPEQKEVIAEQKIEKKAETAPAVAATVPAPAAPVVAKSEELIDIEKILSEGLEKVYAELPENRRQEFKEEGEQVAVKVETLMKKVKVKIHAIIKLIREWLQKIPGINKFYLEQEAKIKADKLLQYKKDKSEQ